jgi:hypothetical protein
MITPCFYKYLLTGVIINIPMIIIGGAVQLGGTACNNGEKNDEKRKRMPQTTAVRPVLPPSITPAQDSLAMMTEEVPGVLEQFGFRFRLDSLIIEDARNSFHSL